MVAVVPVDTIKLPEEFCKKAHWLWSFGAGASTRSVVPPIRAIEWNSNVNYCVSTLGR